jgi:precorrin-3B methylase
MNKETLDAAVEAARRFLSSVDDLRNDEYDMRTLTVVGSRKTGEVRRRSMDLTRALADMRRPS